MEEFIRGDDYTPIDSFLRKNRTKLAALAPFVQHGRTSCLLHSVAVAYYSERLAQTLGVKYRENDLLCGALLHDYFLYDWHTAGNRIHGFTHPKTALRNAERDFKLSRVERDIIRKHMFPLTLLPPACRESLFVCLVDKACSIYEIAAKKNPYPRLSRRVRISMGETGKNTNKRICANIGY